MRFGGRRVSRKILTQTGAGKTLIQQRHLQTLKTLKTLKTRRTETKLMARDYKKEYTDYHGTPKQKKNRASRNAARRKAMAKGKVRKGDKKDIHHRDGNPRNNRPENLAVLARSKNRAIK
jgi:hypothetical protein